MVQYNWYDVHSGWLYISVEWDKDINDIYICDCVYMKSYISPIYFYNVVKHYFTTSEQTLLEMFYTCGKREPVSTQQNILRNTGALHDVQ